MNPRLVSICVTSDPKIQGRVEKLLERNAFTEGECAAVLQLIEAHVEGAFRQWLRDNPEMVLRAGASAVDTVWAARSIKGAASGGIPR
jgi:hypothetical protein